MTSQAEPFEMQFERAVAAIDAGDLLVLEEMLAAVPELAVRRLDGAGAWLRDRIGTALDGFFARPFLLWFVAEDPVRNGRLPQNIVEIAGVIVAAVKRSGDASIKEQLDATLRLVSWSWIAAQEGVQLDLIDLLVDAGADPAGNPNNALVNGHAAAAEHLISRGAPVTLAAAVCLGRWADAERLASRANAGKRQFALVLAALNGRADGVRWMLAAGADPNAPSGDLYSHGTPLHHAVCSGSLETVQALVTAGADLDRTDTAWNGTPLGWALHYLEEGKPEAREKFAAIADYLRGAH